MLCWSAHGHFIIIESRCSFEIRNTVNHIYERLPQNNEINSIFCWTSTSSIFFSNLWFFFYLCNFFSQHVLFFDLFLFLFAYHFRKYFFFSFANFYFIFIKNLLKPKNTRVWFHTLRSRTRLREKSKHGLLYLKKNRMRGHNYNSQSLKENDKKSIKKEREWKNHAQFIKHEQTQVVDFFCLWKKK